MVAQIRLSLLLSFALVSILGCRRGTLQADLFEGNIRFVGGNDVYREFVTREQDGQIADVFIRFDDNRVYALRSLDVSQLQPYASKTYSAQWDNEREKSQICKMEGASWFRFRGGRIVYARIATGDVNSIALAKSRDGPFLVMPVERDTVLSSFGEPVSSEEAVIGAP
ncbi:MAG: hypothetical protein RIC55_36015 [Pirellulaceae bacterium]